jgi:hypothetical protein
MTTYVIANGGGNWNAAATYVANSGFPVAGDTVTATGTSGNLTVNVASACAVLDLTGYVGTFNIANGITLTTTGNITLGSGMTWGATTGGQLTIGSGGSSPTITTNGILVKSILAIASLSTITFADDCTANAAVNLGGGANAVTLNGSNLNCKSNFSPVTTGTISGTTNIVMTGTGNLDGTSGATINNNITINTSGTTTLVSTFKYGGGTFTYTAGTFNPGTSTLSITSSCTLNLPAASVSLKNLTHAAAVTVTLSADLNITGTLTPSNANLTFAGAFNITCANLSHVLGNNGARTVTLVAGQTLTVTTLMSMLEGTAQKTKFLSATPGTKAKLTIGPAATQQNNWCDFTDIDASGGQPIVTAGGTVTTCNNVYNSYPPVIRRPSILLGVG